MKFGDNLKKLRKQNNINQEVLASKVGVSRQSVSKWETGEAYPEMNNILQLCKIFHCNINDLVNDNIIDLDSLDEEIKMSVVKFKSDKQKKVKVLSKIIAVISKIGRIVSYVAIPFVILTMIILPILINKIEIKNNKAIINGFDKIELIEENNKIIIKVNDKIAREEEKIETVNIIKNTLENNSKTRMIVYIEISGTILITSLVLISLLLKNSEELANNINLGDTPFTLENVKKIKRIAYYMISLIVVPTFSSLILSLILPTISDLSIEVFDIIEILIVFLLAYIFEYGYEIQLDSKGKIYGDENE